MTVRRAQQACTIAAAAALPVLAACIIADPPTDLPRLLPRKPSIFRANAQPPDSKVLGKFPGFSQPGDGFNVDVEADPSTPLEWRLFVDYDPLTGAGLVGRNTDPGSPDGGVRHITMVPNDPTAPDPTRCHVIEGLVAYKYFDPPPIQNEHSFDPSLGDSIVWFYSPTGDLSGCPVFRSTLDGAFPNVEASTFFVGEGGAD